MGDMKKKILEAFIREGILRDDAESLQEYAAENPEEYWEYKTLEEFVADQIDEDEYMDEALVGDQTKQYDIGDIIFTNAFYSNISKKVVRKSENNGKSGHKIIVITSKRDEDGVVHYLGFVLTSNISNSNKMGGYPNKLYINNYGSILSRGSKTDMEAAVNVDDLVKCNSRDLSPAGTYKGHVTDEFLEFLQKGYSNYKSHGDNSQMFWEK